MLLKVLKGTDVHGDWALLVLDRALLRILIRVAVLNGLTAAPQIVGD